MLRLENFIKKIYKGPKIVGLAFLLVIILIMTIGIPSWARFKNRVTLNNVVEWDGNVAESYRDGSGTVEDPYIISNGAELAYFSEQLLENDYENTYFKLSKDILLNRGLFKYDLNDGLMYILDNEIYYVDPYTNKYYDNVERTGEEVGTINVLNSLDSFKGNFDGSSFTIHGLYVTDANKEELALFTDLNGIVHDLYVENAVIYGGSYTAGIASNSENASLKNILFDGYVIGKNENVSKTINVELDETTVPIKNEETVDYAFFKNKIPLIGGDVAYTTVTGEYELSGFIDEEVTIKVNGEEVTGGSFEVELGSYLLNLVSFSTYTDSSNEGSVTFKNLKYNIEYDYGIAGGVVGLANNIVLENVVNKADVYSYSVSGGIVSVATDTVNIYNSYNEGKIVSEHVSAGLIGVIEKSDNPFIIESSYNTGEISGIDVGGFFGIVSEALEPITIKNSFDASISDFCIGTIDYSYVQGDNVYYTNGDLVVNEGSVSGSFIKTTMENLTSKDFLLNNLMFNEFSNFEDLENNPLNVWIFENNHLPILFIDDIENPLANIHVSRYTWNNFSNTLSNIKLDTNITFMIQETDDLHPVKEKYYYISNSLEPLSFDDVLNINEWTLYDDIVQITEEGYYVIYAKIVDYDDNVTYMNTDLLILDLPGTIASINGEGYSWDVFKTDLEYVYVDKEISLNVMVNDDISNVSSIKYHISDEVLSETQLDQLSGSDWIPFVDEIVIDEFGKHIVYLQIIDDFDYVSYLNTDYIIYDGYTLNEISFGRNQSSNFELTPYITGKSTVTYNFIYNTDNVINLEGHTHNLVTNILLPVSTKITLIDNVENKVYNYQILTDEDLYNYHSSCDDGDCEKRATYPFTLFSRIGHTTEKFVESSYDNNGTIMENFTVILDFSNTNISSDYHNVSVNIELHNPEGKNVRPTLEHAMNNINIYSNMDAQLVLTTDFVGPEIMYNSDSTTYVNLTSKINYQEIDGLKVIDTRFEDKEVGLAIKLVDDNDNILDKENLKNFVFKIDEQRYYPENDNIIRINLNSGIEEITKTLTIITNSTHTNLEPGQYYLKISNYVSVDGHYFEELGINEVAIPVVVTDDDIKVEYGFDVIVDDESRIIKKTEENVNVSFAILQNGAFKNANIRVALYKKDQLTAYDQTYSLVDLREYVTNNLDVVSDKIYYVTTNPFVYDGREETLNHFDLNLETQNFEKTGYKFVFSLYDNNKKIVSIEKYFIVR